jgi:uncharacterized protein
MEIFALTFFLFFLIAALYASVGHAGASGYLAIMALLSFSPDTIKPTSLILNCFVALIASYKFIRAGYFDRKIFLAFVVTSIPMAFVGGYTGLDPRYFKLFAGIFLVVSAILLIAREFIQASGEIRPMPRGFGLVIGAVIGLISGLIGVGGGIFLSPILILARWTTVKQASGVAALFILCNSVIGLAGYVTALNKIDLNLSYWILAVVLGGYLGAYFGTSRFNNKWILAFLFLVLMSAGLKFIFVDFNR